MKIRLKVSASMTMDLPVRIIGPLAIDTTKQEKFKADTLNADSALHTRDESKPHTHDKSKPHAL
jgi:hypothetical protein